MAWTTVQIEAALDKLRTALARGEQSVSFADRGLTYRSTEQIIAAIREFEGMLAAAAERPRQFLGSTSKGM